MYSSFMNLEFSFEILNTGKFPFNNDCYVKTTCLLNLIINYLGMWFDAEHDYVYENFNHSSADMSASVIFTACE